MTCDVIVIGAGPAGSAAAIALARRGRSVAVVEKAAFPRRKLCGEFLSAASLPLIDRLGIGEAWAQCAGPEVRRLALFAGDRTVEAPMPAVPDGRFGRALARDVLDDLLLREAARAGALIFQPWRAVSIRPDGGRHAVRIVAERAAMGATTGAATETTERAAGAADTGGQRGPSELTLRAPIVIAAHGSWEPGPLPTQLPKAGAAGDFLAFKAHFRNASLAAGLMPLLAVPGGYGGAVWTNDGRLSVSCCIRRDALAELRRREGGIAAAEAVHRHLIASCSGLRGALAGAERDGAWLAAGPIRPGIRGGYADGIFRVGNAAGESHPIVAEGISMAIQSGWLAAAAISGAGAGTAAPDGRDAAGARYDAAWRTQFRLRIHAASAFARLAAHPRTAGPAGSLLAALPSALTWGARLSGKTKPLPGLAAQG